VSHEGLEKVYKQQEEWTAVDIIKNNQFIVTARYQGKMDKRREQRIYTACDRYGVRVVAHPVYVLMAEDGSKIPITRTDIEWTQNDDGSDHGLKIYIDDRERATRLASELRACGLMVSVGVHED
jgi:hypothetical protein